MQRLDRPLRTLLVTLALLAVSGIASAQGVTDMKKVRAAAKSRAPRGLAALPKPTVL